MNLVDRAKNILLKPKQEWEIINEETTTTADLYKNYIIYLAAIGPIAAFIGMSIVGVSMPFGDHFVYPSQHVLLLPLYLISLASLAFIFLH